MTETVITLTAIHDAAHCRDPQKRSVCDRYRSGAWEDKVTLEELSARRKDWTCQACGHHNSCHYYIGKLHEVSATPRRKKAPRYRFVPGQGFRDVANENSDDD